MLQKTLEEMGLTRRESICYISLLELGSSKVGEVVKKTGIPSSKIYEVLGKLIKRGFVSHVIKNNIRHYQATDPKCLIDDIEERKKEVEKVIPELLLRQKLATKQSVGLYEGQQAIFSLFTTLISDAKVGEQYLVFSINEENKNKQANLFFKNLTVRRKEKKLDVRLWKNNKLYVRENHTKLKLKYTPFNLPQGITIFRNNVILLSWKDSPLAIKIESGVFANQLKEFFLDLWKTATP